jgi:hypothetical protein
MPTFKAYKDGKLIDEFTGAVPAKLTVSCHESRLALLTVSFYCFRFTLDSRYSQTGSAGEGFDRVMEVLCIPLTK